MTVHDGREVFGRYLEGFRVGDVYKHWPGKTITEMDDHLFCLLTMNHNPIHFDEEYARTIGHGKVLVVGTYVFSLAVGMAVKDTSGKGIAALDYEKITHDGPVFIGDTVYAESEVLDVRPSRTKSDRGVVYLEVRAHNQRGERVLTFRRHVLVPRRPAAVPAV
ncbi:MAG: MaoC family dehydratase [Chloroflexi bacterium]|nr:MaoC family dehydratase [Chloroflexota bacterium]